MFAGLRGPVSLRLVDACPVLERHLTPRRRRAANDHARRSVDRRLALSGAVFCALALIAALAGPWPLLG